MNRIVLTAALLLGALILSPSASYAEPKPATATPPAAPLYAGSDVGKAVDAMASACGAAQAQLARIEALVAQRSASQANLAKAQQALAKHRKVMLSTKQRLDAEAKRGGASTDPLIDSARRSYESTLEQARTIEAETKSLQAADEELSKLLAVISDSSAACEANEATLRAAAVEARKQVASARTGAGKARALAKLAPEATRKASRERQSRQLEELKASTDEARAELETIEQVAFETKKKTGEANDAAAASAKRAQ
jgi:hypothetical protein